MSTNENVSQDSLISVGEYKLHSILEGILNNTLSDLSLIGNDCACIEVPGMPELVLLATTDRLPLNTELSISAKLCVAQNISDIVCMGGQPSAFLLALTLPRNFSLNNFKLLHYEIKEELKKYNCAFVGGDTKEGPNFHMVGVAIGFATRKSLVLRKGAKPGMKIGVTCTKGKLWGLRWARAVVRYFDLSLPEAFINHLEESDKDISLPIEETKAIISTQSANAGLDLSDGIGGALDILERVNNVGFLLYETCLESLVTPEIDLVAKQLGISRSAFSLSPGYMWENIYCIDADKVEEVSTAVSRVQGNFIIIGEVTPEVGVYLQERGEKRKISLTSDEKFKDYEWLDKPLAWLETSKQNGLVYKGM